MCFSNSSNNNLYLCLQEEEEEKEKVCVRAHVGSSSHTLNTLTDLGTRCIGVINTLCVEKGKEVRKFRKFLCLFRSLSVCLKEGREKRGCWIV